MNSRAGVETLLRQGAEGRRGFRSADHAHNVFQDGFRGMQNYVEHSARSSTARCPEIVDRRRLSLDASRSSTTRTTRVSSTRRLVQGCDPSSSAPRADHARGCADASERSQADTGRSPWYASGPAAAPCGSDAPRRHRQRPPQRRSGPCNHKAATLTRQPPSFPVDRIIPCGGWPEADRLPRRRYTRPRGAEDTRRLDNQTITSSATDR